MRRIKPTISPVPQQQLPFSEGEVNNSSKCEYITQIVLVKILKKRNFFEQQQKVVQRTAS